MNLCDALQPPAQRGALTGVRTVSQSLLPRCSHREQQGDNSNSLIYGTGDRLTDGTVSKPPHRPRYSSWQTQFRKSR